MFDPNLGRWMQNDPLGFEAGDENLYRYVENNPANLTDPSGLQPLQVGPEPRIIEEGVGQPPDYRDMRPPPVTRGGKVYSNPRALWDIVRFTRDRLNIVRFNNQRSQTREGTVTEVAEVSARGARRFPDGTVNNRGDHIAWVVVQIRFVKRTRTNAMNQTTMLPDWWMRIGFSLNYGVFLRSARPPALDTVSESDQLKVLPTDTWRSFVDRFISLAQAIAGR